MKPNADLSQNIPVDASCSNVSTNPYQLISCSFYDELEALATLHRTCTISYRTETGESASVESSIIDLFITNKSEFLKLQNGTQIRLDHLISVNGIPVRFANH